MRMLGIPPSTMTSASETFAHVTPIAPKSIWRRAIQGERGVFIAGGDLSLGAAGAAGAGADAAPVGQRGVAARLAVAGRDRLGEAAVVLADRLDQQLGLVHEGLPAHRLGHVERGQGALEIGRSAAKGATILCMLPDTGERYLSTPLFADIPADMTEEELAISRSTPTAQMGA